MHITAPTPQTFQVMQDTVRLVAPAEHTGGRFFVMEVDVPPGGGPPPIHTHPPHELFFTLDGELTYFRDDGGDELTVITGGPGTSAFIPSGVGHTYRNFSDAPARYLAIVGPGAQMQEFLIRAGVAPGAAPLRPEEIIALSEPYGFAWTAQVPGPRG